MTSWQRIVIYSLLVFVVLLIFVQESVDAKRANKAEKVKDRVLREEKRQLKKEGKKIKKSFSKKYEQIYISLCPDCYAKLLTASENCVQQYEKLNLVMYFIVQFFEQKKKNFFVDTFEFKSLIRSASMCDTVTFSMCFWCIDQILILNSIY